MRPALRLLAAALSAVVALTVGLASSAPGDLDPAFDGDGIAIFDKQTNPRFNAVLRHSSGVLYAAGGIAVPDGGGFLLARCLPSGAPDTSYGPQGWGMHVAGSGGEAAADALVE